MLSLRYWERGKRPEGALGIEISGSFYNLAGELSRKFQNEVSINGDVCKFPLLKNGFLRIAHKQSKKRGLYADIAIRGDTPSAIEELARRTDLPYAAREIEKI